MAGLRRLGIDTYQEPVAYLRSDCPVCKSEGFGSHSRIEVWRGEQHIVATLNVVHDGVVELDQLGLSEVAWRALGGADGDQLRVAHAQPVQSLSAVRAKIYCRPIGAEAAGAIVRDVVAGRDSDIEMAALITACSGDRMDVTETIALTRAMVAACGLIIPKTSSRAITSPAGTADTMETLAPVTLDLPAMRRVVEREGGCIAWGGAVSLSPADDVLIRVERPLGLDSDGMMVASVLSKKIAAGSTHVVIDIPVGRTAKVRSQQAAHALAHRLDAVGAALGINVSVMLSDGSQPVGHGVGPALEAWDVLAVLQNQIGAPDDLRQRALLLAGRVLELGRKATPGDGQALARSVLDSGAAWSKLQAICEAQGGMRTPPRAAYTHVLTSPRRGRVVAIDNRRLARLAKLAGAPQAPAAGLELHAPLGTVLSPGQPLLTLPAESPGELAYALVYAESQGQRFSFEEL